MRLWIREAEADGDNVEERRVGQFRAPTSEIVPGMEDELELAGARLVSAHQRFVGAPVGIGYDIDDKLAL
jgi:hypothetical protein